MIIVATATFEIEFCIDVAGLEMDSSLADIQIEAVKRAKETIRNKIYCKFITEPHIKGVKISI